MAIKFNVLDDNEVHGVLLNAMYCAARQYEELAKVQAVEGMSAETLDKLNQQFAKQAKDARALAERIESAVTVNLAIEG